MNRINVIDLDGTLLPYDSVSRWIRHFKRLEGWFSPLRRWSLLYRFGWMDRSTFIQKCVDHLRQRDDYTDFNREFAGKLVQDISKSTLQQIEQHTDALTVNILCSASPDDYVSLVAGHLKWECRASGYRADGRWQLLYGTEKLKRIREDFSPDTYRYHFAIADDASDLELLGAFEHSVLIRKGDPR